MLEFQHQQTPTLHCEQVIENNFLLLKFDFSTNCSKIEIRKIKGRNNRLLYLKNKIYVEFFNIDKETREKILKEKNIGKEVELLGDSLVVEVDLDLSNKEQKEEMLKIFEKYKDNIPSFTNIEGQI